MPEESQSAYDKRNLILIQNYILGGSEIWRQSWCIWLSHLHEKKVEIQKLLVKTLNEFPLDIHVDGILKLYLNSD